MPRLSPKAQLEHSLENYIHAETLCDEIFGKSSGNSNRFPKLSDRAKCPSADDDPPLGQITSVDDDDMELLDAIDSDPEMEVETAWREVVGSNQPVHHSSVGIQMPLGKLFSEVREEIKGKRYWADRGWSKGLNLRQWFDGISNPRQFRSLFRMDSEHFFELLVLIKDHPVFHNQSNNKQFPVQYQLCVFLYRLGGAEGGGSHARTGILLGLGEGTVSLFSNRVLRAILDLREEYIQWPTAPKADQIKKRIGDGSRQVFQDCIGFIDGTFIILKYAPFKDWYFYWNRKSTYAINAMVVCTDKTEITYTRVGDTSAVHDSRVFGKSRLATHAEEFFKPHEYLIGDTAYTCNDHMITPFKKPRSSQKGPKLFNATLSSRRIAIEHTFGLIKARFPALTNISICIHDIKSHETVVHWFEVACVLHNFLLQRNDPEWGIDNEEQDDLSKARAHEREVMRLQKDMSRRQHYQRMGKSALREYLLDRCSKISKVIK